MDHDMTAAMLHLCIGLVAHMGIDNACVILHLSGTVATYIMCLSNSK